MYTGMFSSMYVKGLSILDYHTIFSGVINNEMSPKRRTHHHDREFKDYHGFREFALPSRNWGTAQPPTVWYNVPPTRENKHPRYNIGSRRNVKQNVTKSRNLYTSKFPYTPSPNLYSPPAKYAGDESIL